MAASSVARPAPLTAYLTVSALIDLGTWVLLLPGFRATRGWSSLEIGWANGSYFVVNLACQVFASALGMFVGPPVWGIIADRAG